MKRRDFFKTAGISSAALVSLPAFAKPAPAPAEGRRSRRPGRGTRARTRRRPRRTKGPSPTPRWLSASGTPTPRSIVSRTTRRSRATTTICLPGEVTIKAGGSVSFIISGFHLVLVYGPGTKPTDINRDSRFPVTQPSAADQRSNESRVPGADPSVFPVLAGGTARLQDRVEVVRFPNPGRYLVICAGASALLRHRVR